LRCALERMTARSQAAIHAGEPAPGAATEGQGLDLAVQHRARRRQRRSAWRASGIAESPPYGARKKLLNRSLPSPSSPFRTGASGRPHHEGLKRRRTKARTNNEANRIVALGPSMVVERTGL